MSKIGSENISSNIEPTVDRTSTPLIQLPPPEDSEPLLAVVPPPYNDAVHHNQQLIVQSPAIPTTTPAIPTTTSAIPATTQQMQQYQPQGPQPQQYQPQPQQYQPQPQHCESGYRVVPSVVPSVSVSSPSMANDIPRTEKAKIFLLIGLFVAYTFVLFLNFIVAIVGTVIYYQQYYIYLQRWMISTIVLSFVWLLVLPVAALFGWLLPIYYAYKKHSLFCFIWFFMVMVVQCFVWLIIPIGTPAINVGVIQGLVVHPSVGIAYFVISGLWLLMVIGGVIAIISIMIYVVRNYKLLLSRQVTVNQPQLNQVY